MTTIDDGEEHNMPRRRSEEQIYVGKRNYQPKPYRYNKMLNLNNKRITNIKEYYLLTAGGDLRRLVDLI